jgi:hypothetical protein
MPKFKPKYVTFRDIKNMDVNKYREDVKNIPWFTLHELDPDTMHG